MTIFIIPFLFYLIICNWIQIYYLLGNILKPKRVIKTVNGKGLLSILKKKTGLDLIIKTMSEKKKAIGFMVSTPPFKPLMIFSERLYKLLNKDEFEWVVLHESAHYLMWHNLKFALIQISLLVIGIYSTFLFPILNQLNVPYFVLLALIYIQLVKRFEYQADLYAIAKMDNPKGLITANIKMKRINKFLNSSNFIYKTFVIQVPYNERIRMAEDELRLRKNK